MKQKYFDNLLIDLDAAGLKKPLIYSLLLHLVFPLIIYLIVSLNIKWEPTFIKNVVTIQSAVRVDVVDMPKYTIQELKAMKLPPIATTVTSPPPAKSVNEKTINPEVQDELTFKEKGKKSLNEILKNLSKKDIKLDNKKAAEKKVDGDGKNTLSKNELKQLILEGNKLSKGSALVGDSSEVSMAEFESYANTLPDLVKRYWKLPSYLMDANLKCRIRVYISSKGKLIKAIVYESSGVVEYDQKAVSAVEQVQSFPIPPNSVIHRLSSGDVILGFPL
ncbi:MAG: cell envelope integrity protein TolA [Bacteriovoracaceae bacterium]|nr:cell envelope integrity protein TolA [Bacteriovoracaceae bacterium]